MIRAADAVLAITAGLRPSVLELMDRTSDQRGRGQARRWASTARPARCCWSARTPRDPRPPPRSRPIRAGLHPPRRATSSQPPTTRPRARPSPPPAAPAFPPSSSAATCCSRTSAYRCPPCPRWCEGVAEIAERPRPTIALVAHAGDGNTHPIDRLRRRRPRLRPPAPHSPSGPVMDLALEPRWHDHRRTRRGPFEEGVAARVPGPGRPGPDSPHQGCAGP